MFYFTVGLFQTAEKFRYFWLFFTLNVAIYAFFGQAFICFVPDVPTSGALVGALIGYNIFFSGYIVKPPYFRGPFQLGLWTAPGRFAFGGIVTTQFDGVMDPVQATQGSPFFFHLQCGNVTDAASARPTLRLILATMLALAQCKTTWNSFLATSSALTTFGSALAF